MYCFGFEVEPDGKYPEDCIIGDKYDISQEIKPVPADMLEQIEWELLEVLYLFGTAANYRRTTTNGRLKPGVYLDFNTAFVVDVDCKKIQKYLSFCSDNLCKLAICFTEAENLDIGNLSQIWELTLNDTPPVKGIEKLSSLQTLKIIDGLETGINGVNLPEKLEELEITNTYIETLSSIILPPHLCELKICDSIIMDFDSVLFPRSLHNLDLSATYIDRLSSTVLPQSLFSLNLSEAIIMDWNDISFPESLFYLDLSGTDIEVIPDSIATLKHLRTLDLSYLELTDLPPWLTELNLDFSLEWNEHGIILDDTIVDGVDMSIFEQPLEIIREWFKERHQVPLNELKIPLNELKVVFLGDGGAGKSHTIARLLKDGGQTKDFPDISTPGIVIQDKTYPYDNKEVKVHFWDFGGQEILHSMHRMFLTERTLYVVMLNVRDGTQDDRARYWLYNLRSFAKGAPVLLVLNQMDMNENATLNESDLRKLYPTLAPNVVKLSTLKYSDVEFEEKFIDVLRRQIGNMDILNFPFTLSWIRLKEKLQNMEDYYIDGDKFREFCDECGVTDSGNIRRDLLNWFSNLGISFCYSGSASLEDYVVLRPDWITNAIYIVLFNKAETANNGQVSHEVIYKMLSSRDMEKYRRTVTTATYKPHEVDYVLKVFRKFRLSFLAEDGIEFLPMLCEANAKPISALYENDPDALEFRMHYEYLPNNVIHRLMVDHRRELNLSNVWLYGGQFRNDCTGLSAVVKTEGNLLRIMVRRENSECAPQLYLGALKKDIERINAEMGLTVANTEVVYKAVGKTACFDYEDLLFAQEMGDTHISCRELRKRVPIADILKQSGHSADIARQEFIQNLTDACRKLQSNPIYWNVGEDARTTGLRDALSNRYITMDQHLSGAGATGKRSGEMDLDIRLESNTPWTAIEALNISGAQFANWDSHLDKLLTSYNNEGRSFLFHVSYVSADMDKFGDIITKFWDHVQKYHPPKMPVRFSNRMSLARERHDEPGFVRAMECVYDCGGIPMTVYHFFVRIGE